MKERKLSRGLLTTGQRIAKAVEQVSKGVCSGVTHPDVAAHDVPENEQYTSDYEANVFVNDDNPFPDIQGIMWIHDSPSLKQAPLRSFQELEVRNNCQKVQKIFADVMTKFAPKYKNIFDDLALQNWSLWKDRELSRWGEVLQQVIGDCDGARHGNLELPLPYAFRANVSAQSTEIMVEDSAPADLPDHLEQICHNSFHHGAFTSAQKLDSLRHVIADEEQVMSPTATVFSGLACIFKYEFPNKINGTIKTQIGVGIVSEVQGDPASPDATFDIRFCPPKGGRPQTATRPDTLYVNIDAAKAYNMNFTVKRGNKRVPDLSKGVPKDVMLAFNLELNAAGTFSKKRLTDSKYNLSSFQLADSVINRYYSSIV